MKKIKQSLQKYKVIHNHNDLPLIQNRKLMRAISVEQIFEKVKQNVEKEDNLDEKKGLVKKMFVKNVNFDGAAESERIEQQIRSRSLTNRVYRSKGNDEKIILPLNEKVKTSKRLDLDSQLQMKNIDWHKQHVNQVLNNLIQSKLNRDSRQTESDKKFNTITMSQNNLLNIKTERTITRRKKPQQNEFEKLISPDVPLLSFRQFAKLQGFKLPQFLQ